VYKYYKQDSDTITLTGTPVITYFKKDTGWVVMWMDDWFVIQDLQHKSISFVSDDNSILLNYNFWVTLDLKDNRYFEYVEKFSVYNLKENFKNSKELGIKGLYSDDGNWAHDTIIINTDTIYTHSYKDEIFINKYLIFRFKEANNNVWTLVR